MPTFTLVQITTMLTGVTGPMLVSLLLLHPALLYAGALARSIEGLKPGSPVSQRVKTERTTPCHYNGFVVPPPPDIVQ